MVSFANSSLLLSLKKYFCGSLHFLIPHLCIACLREADLSTYPALCHSCRDVFWSAPRCKRCNQPCHIQELSKTRCHYCKDIAYPFQTLQTLGPYKGWLRTAIIQYKFYQDPLALVYLQKLCSLFHFKEDSGVFTYIPSHQSRLKERGFKEQHLPIIYSSFLKKFNFSSLSLLSKKHQAKAQVELSGQARREAVIDSLDYIGPKPAPNCVYLFDDVTTTGATLKEAARVLKYAGVQRIYCIALASPSYSHKSAS